jgi:hypothetical protein
VKTAATTSTTATSQLTAKRFTDLDKLYLVKFSRNRDFVLGSSQFFVLAQPSQKICTSKVVKSDSKIIISICSSKYFPHSVFAY